jgi:hypothetical protein
MARSHWYCTPPPVSSGVSDLHIESRKGCHVLPTVGRTILTVRGPSTFIIMANRRTRNSRAEQRLTKTVEWTPDHPLPCDEPADRHIAVTVEFLSGASQVVVMRTDHLVFDLKQRLYQMGAAPQPLPPAPQKMLGMHPKAQRLVFNGTLLVDSDSIDHYHIRDGSHVYMSPCRVMGRSWSSLTPVH